MSRRLADTKQLLTERALRDIAAIETYSVGEWGKRIADKYIADLEAALTRIREKPDLLRPEKELHPDLCFNRVNKHLLVCDVQPKTVFVLTVIHAIRDILSRLAEIIRRWPQKWRCCIGSWIRRKRRGSRSAVTSTDPGTFIILGTFISLELTADPAQPPDRRSTVSHSLLYSSTALLLFARTVGQKRKLTSVYYLLYWPMLHSNPLFGNLTSVAVAYRP